MDEKTETLSSDVWLQFLKLPPNGVSDSTDLCFFVTERSMNDITIILKRIL